MGDPPGELLTRDGSLAQAIRVLVSPANGFIFIHVPKTGGVSVREALRPHVAGEFWNAFAWHCRARDVENIINNWDRFFRFGFVRNPWAAQVSMYRYVMAKGPQHPEWAEVQGYASFAKYLDTHMKRNWEAGSVPRQFDYLYNRDGACLVSFVGRFERLEKDFMHVCQILDLPKCSLPLLNSSGDVNYYDYYDAASRQLVGRIFEKDIESFGYLF